MFLFIEIFINITLKSVLRPGDNLYRIFFYKKGFSGHAEYFYFFYLSEKLSFFSREWGVAIDNSKLYSLWGSPPPTPLKGTCPIKSRVVLKALHKGIMSKKNAFLADVSSKALTPTPTLLVDDAAV